MVIRLILIILLAIIIRLWSNQFVNDNMHKYNVVDVCHDIFPNLSDVNMIVTVYDSYTIVPIILLLYKTIKNKNWVILKEYLVLASLLNILRGFFYTITILPNPNSSCKLNNASIWNDIISGTCHDLIFSGHIGNSFLAWKFLIEYYNIPERWAIVHQIILVFLMLSQRKHYSIDVIIAYLTVYTLFDNKDMIYDFFNI